MVEILRATKLVLSRIVKRFGIVQEDPTSSAVFYVKNKLYPITNADKLLVIPSAQKSTNTATSGTDTYTVPKGKVWTVLALTMTRANAGTMKWYANMNSVVAVTVDQSAPTDTQLIANFNPFQLKSGDFLEAVFSAGTSGALNSHVIYEEEDVY